MRSQTCDLTLRLMCADGSAGFLSSSCPAPDIPRSTLAPKSSSGFSISPGSAPPYLYRDRLRYAEDGDGKSAPLVKPTLWTAAMELGSTRASTRFYRPAKKVKNRGEDALASSRSLRPPPVVPFRPSLYAIASLPQTVPPLPWCRYFSLLSSPLDLNSSLSLSLLFCRACLDLTMTNYENSKLEERLQHLLVQFQVEAGVLDRMVYKNKNQHRRSSYFQYLLKVFKSFS
ncbi:hypothetical protein B296_00037597 [Ensete ventricosum]|uniref:Uncharacterized protein n=1 Tax=Ensete ventricosum TaxID=4639 RepID=A0A426ZZ50_ENSVE|nr:hypothetical protein B296_00037597 [Ensete ventricosum]